MNDSIDKNDNDYVIAISSDQMGGGDEGLGRILIKAFLNSLHGQALQPTHVLFYNSGVILCREDSDVLPALKDLERNGIEIVLCGTCVDYYDLKNRLGAGTVSNMGYVTGVMARAGHVVKP